MKEKKLIINADDFGLNKDINRGALLCFRAGVVTSVSLLVNERGFNDALKIIRDNPEIDTGVHLNIFSGRALTRPKYISNRQNIFPENITRFLFNYYAHKKEAEKEIKEEFKKQIETCLSHDIHISHLDTEKHVHILPGVFNILLELAREYKIKYVRMPFEKEIFARLKVNALQTFKINTSIAFLEKNKKLMSNFSDIKSTYNFYGISLSRNFSLSNIRILLENIESGISELSCHPGTSNNDRSYIDRVKELKVLTDPRVKEYLDKNNIGLTNFLENHA